MEYLIDGIVLIDKDENETSYDVVRKVKDSLGRGKAQKVGHAGTLDPFATGLLIVLLGQGTRLSQHIMSGDKVYLATMRLGIETDTLDFTGRVSRISKVPDLKYKYIQDKVKGFIGVIEQVPPIYSAVKYQGTRAYKLARKGIKVDLRKKTVTIYSIRIHTVNLPDITMEVKCSGGTYIRKLAADLGRELGTVSHLKSLKRLSSGSFEVEDALPSKEISTKQTRGVLLNKVISLRDALPEMREIEIEDLFAEKVRHGYRPTWEELTKSLNITGHRPERVCDVENYKDGHVKLVMGGELIAIVKVKKIEDTGYDKVKSVKVFRS